MALSPTKVLATQSIQESQRRTMEPLPSTDQENTLANIGMQLDGPDIQSSDRAVVERSTLEENQGAKSPATRESEDQTDAGKPSTSPAALNTSLFFPPPPIVDASHFAASIVFPRGKMVNIDGPSHDRSSDKVSVEKPSLDGDSGDSSAISKEVGGQKDAEKPFTSTKTPNAFPFFEPPPIVDTSHLAANFVVPRGKMVNIDIPCPGQPMTTPSGDHMTPRPTLRALCVSPSKPVEQKLPLSKQRPRHHAFGDPPDPQNQPALSPPAFKPRLLAKSDGNPNPMDQNYHSREGHRGSPDHSNMSGSSSPPGQLQATEHASLPNPAPTETRHQHFESEGPSRPDAKSGHHSTVLSRPRNKDFSPDLRDAADQMKPQNEARHGPHMASAKRCYGTKEGLPSSDGDLDFPSTAHWPTMSHEMATRPLRESVRGFQPRPLSRGWRPQSRDSNVSKLRVPSIGSFNQGLTQKAARAKLSSDIASQLNSYLLHAARAEEVAALEKSRAERDIHALKAEVDTKSRELSESRLSLENNTLSVDQLRHEKLELTNNVKALEKELQENSNRMKILNEKCRSYKGFLNKAIKEHQDLASEVRGDFQRGSDRIRDEIKAERSLCDSAFKKAEELREDLLQSVKPALSESRNEILNLNQRINDLVRELDHRNSELSRDKATIRNLEQELKMQQDAQRRFEEVSNSRAMEIIAKLDGLQNTRFELNQHSEQRTGDRLDTVTERLISLSNLLSEQPDILSSLRTLSEDAISRVVLKLDAIVKSQADGQKSTEELTSFIQNHIGDMWQQLDSRDDALNQQLAEKCRENAILTTKLDEKHEECQEMRIKLHEMTCDLNRDEERIRDLTSRVSTLEAIPRDDPQTLAKLEHLEGKTRQLRAELALKVEHIGQLQGSLRDQDAKYVADTAKATGEYMRLSKLLQEKEVTTRLASEQTVTKVREEAKSEMERMQREHQAQLENAESARSTLEKRLDEAQKQLGVRDLKAPTPTSSPRAHSTATPLEWAEFPSNVKKSIVLEALNADLANAQKQLIDLQENNAESEFKNKILVTELKKMAAGLNDEVVRNNLAKLDDRSITIENFGCVISQTVNKLIPHFLQQLGQPIGSHNHESGIKTAKSDAPGFPWLQIEAASGFSDDVDPVSFTDSTGPVLAGNPDDNRAEPIPPSEEQERLMKRGAVVSQGILKITAQSPLKLEELEESTHDPRPKTIVSHGYGSKEAMTGTVAKREEGDSDIPEQEPRYSVNNPRKRTSNDETGPLKGSKMPKREDATNEVIEPSALLPLMRENDHETVKDNATVLVNRRRQTRAGQRGHKPLSASSKTLTVVTAEGPTGLTQSRRDSVGPGSHSRQRVLKMLDDDPKYFPGSSAHGIHSMSAFPSQSDTTRSNVVPSRGTRTRKTNSNNLYTRRQVRFSDLELERQQTHEQTMAATSRRERSGKPDTSAQSEAQEPSAQFQDPVNDDKPRTLPVLRQRYARRA